MEILSKIKEILSEQLYIEKDCINIDSDLHREFNVDSIDVVVIVIKIEEMFLIKINEEDLNKMITVNDIINIIKAKQI